MFKIAWKMQITQLRENTKYRCKPMRNCWVHNISMERFFMLNYLYRNIQYLSFAGNSKSHIQEIDDWTINEFFGVWIIIGVGGWVHWEKNSKTTNYIESKRYKLQVQMNPSDKQTAQMFKLKLINQTNSPKCSRLAGQRKSHNRKRILYIQTRVYKIN